jgi:hypothetical protein
LKVEWAWKVLVECVEAEPRGGVPNQLGVAAVERRFDLAAYEASRPLQKQQIALDTLHDGVLRVARFLGWPNEPFEAARRAVLERRFVNEWALGPARTLLPPTALLWQAARTP